MFVFVASEKKAEENHDKKERSRTQLHVAHVSPNNQILLLTELLDELLVLVELLQVLSAHEGESESLSLIAVLLVTENADL